MNSDTNMQMMSKVSIPPIWSILKGRDDEDVTSPRYTKGKQLSMLSSHGSDSLETSPRTSITSHDLTQSSSSSGVSSNYTTITEAEFYSRCSTNLEKLMIEKNEISKQLDSYKAVTKDSLVSSDFIKEFSDRLISIQKSIDEITKLQHDYDIATQQEKIRILACQYPSGSSRSSYVSPEQKFLPSFKNLASQPQQQQHQQQQQQNTTSSSPNQISSPTTVPQTSAYQRQPVSHSIPSIHSLSNPVSSPLVPTSNRTLQLKSPNQTKILGPNELANPAQQQHSYIQYTQGEYPSYGYQKQFVNAYQNTRNSEGQIFQVGNENRSKSLNVASILMDSRRGSLPFPAYGNLQPTSYAVHSPIGGNLFHSSYQFSAGSPTMTGYKSATTDAMGAVPASGIINDKSPSLSNVLDSYSVTNPGPKKRGRKKKIKEGIVSSSFSSGLPIPHSLALANAETLKPQHMNSLSKNINNSAGTVVMTSCLHCGENHTPEWRRGPYGNRTLCNACGLFYRKAISKFGVKNANLLLRYRKRISNTANRRVPKMLKIPIGIIEEFDADPSLDSNYNTIRKEE
ncbi:GATA-type zinc finger domain profile [Nakaseomyces glabratus]